MLMIQKDTTVADIEEKLKADDRAEIFELQDNNLWMKSESELNQKWFECYRDTIPLDVFTKAKEETVKVCQRAKGVQIDRSIKLPKIPNADDKLIQLCYDGMKWRGITGKIYKERLKEEITLIRDKEFSSYFLIQKQIVDEARRVGPRIMGWGDGHDAVGPGRGSCVGSLVCYVLGITDVDPIRHNLLFSRFLSPARGGKTMKTRFTKPPIRKIA
jgi:DNA polymerase-3 subunit alpha